jgi:hypothetical protein
MSAITPAAPDDFTAGLAVTVIGGVYDGDHGVVVDQPPDLRPVSVWVQLHIAGVRLVLGYRLVPSDYGSDGPAVGPSDVCRRCAR